MVNRIWFDVSDRDGYYEKPVTLPAAAVWNMDQFLMDYISTGLTWLLEEGHVDWEGTGELYGKPNLREDMERARDLARSYSKDEENFAKGAECLRLIADFGPEFLWD